MALYIYRNHLNRPIKTRLIISVHFSAATPNSSAPQQADDNALNQWKLIIQQAQPGQEVSQSVVQAQAPLNQPAKQRTGAAGVRATVAMRLRLIGSDASTEKEHHHAESLLA